MSGSNIGSRLGRAIDEAYGISADPHAANRRAQAMTDEYPDIWVTGLPLPFPPPLPVGEVNLRTGERRLYNPVRCRYDIGHARPDELATLRAKHSEEGQ